MEVEALAAEVEVEALASPWQLALLGVFLSLHLFLPQLAGITLAAFGELEVLRY